MTYKEWRDQYTPSAIQADHETIVHSAFAAGWKAGYKQSAWAEANFCQRCGKRLHGVLGNASIHTCTPPTVVTGLSIEANFVKNPSINQKKKSRNHCDVY